MLNVFDGATVPHSVDFMRMKLRRKTYGGFSVDEQTAYRWLEELRLDGALKRQLVNVGGGETEWWYEREP